MKKRPTTVGFAPEVEANIKAEAERVGVPWTTMVTILVREALDHRSSTASRSEGIRVSG